MNPNIPLLEIKRMGIYKAISTRDQRDGKGIVAIQYPSITKQSVKEVMFEFMYAMITQS